MWPFSRGRIKQANAQGEPKSRPESEIKYTSTEHSPEDPSLHKRRRTTEYAFDRSNLSHVQSRRHRPRDSVENITALPGARRLETSPHLRQSNYYRTAIPYNTQPQTMATLEKGQPQQKRLSKRQVYHDRAVREEEIRAMSARVHIPKRNSGHGDMLLRENKKARRAFNGKATTDKRGSDVSLPFQDSIHSSMSGGSDSRGWEIQRLNLLSPRPSVRISSSEDPASGMVPHLYKQSKKNKMATVPEGGRRKDRRKVAELADDLDAAELRMLMEREARRKERRAAADRVKLVTKLRRRTSRSRGRERTKTMPDIAHHPAFRSKQSMEKVKPRGPTPPPSMPNGMLQTPSGKDENPFRDPSPSMFAELPREPITPGGRSVPFSTSGVPTPLGSTYDVELVTAQEVHYAHGRLSQIGLFPPGGLTSHPPDTTAFHRDLTPESYPASSPSPNRLQTSETTDKRKSGNWAAFFRRRSSAQPAAAPPAATTSFSNLSRDSMSKQSLPSHLAADQPRRKSSVPARTVSVFREHLPETMAATEPPKARNATGSSPHGSEVIDEEGRAPARPRSKSALSNSLASVDSEGSWLAGHPRSKPSYEDFGAAPDSDVLQRRMDDFPSIERQLRRTTSGTPHLVRNPDAAVSREALPDDEEDLAVRDSSVSSLDDDDYEYEIVAERQDVVFGHGHPRQLSAGSAKLMEIPSRTRSVREGEMSPSLWGGGGTGLVSPPESPRRV